MQLTTEQNNLVQSNLGLVHDIVIKKWNTDLSLKDDLMQEGFMGLCKASQIYDANKGEFSTIATHYINGYMKKYYNRKKVKDTKRELVSIDSHIANNEDNLTLHDIISDDVDNYEIIHNQNVWNRQLQYLLKVITPEELDFILHYHEKSKVVNKRKDDYQQWKKYYLIIRKIRRYLKRKNIVEMEI